MALVLAVFGSLPKYRVFNPFKSIDSSQTPQLIVLNLLF